MCGIVGYASNNVPIQPNLLLKSTGTLSHRGPDDSGIWISPDQNVGFGHRRLSIVDLSPAGHQPMQDSTGRLTITFNGEIYNYKEIRAELSKEGARFRSETDTEVILEAYRFWGKGFLDHLNGMFAFAIHDAITNTVFLARDRAGEKPLFYRLSDGSLCFASELKALLCDPHVQRSINTDALDSYLYMGFVPGQNCLLEGFNKLPPAHAMDFNLTTGTLSVWRYWTLPDYSENKFGSNVPHYPESLSHDMEMLLEDAVSRQLEADVPVGVLLSGGVDSSLITALACRKTNNIKTFTVRFPEAALYDESAHARLIAEHFGTTHLELDADTASVDLLESLAQQFDEPVIDSSMFPTYLVSKLVREHCTVALGGDGGDELFGGYIHYPRLLWMAQKPGKFPYALRRMISGAGLAMLPVGFKGKNWLSALGADFRNGLPIIANYFDNATRSSLLPDLGLGKSAEDIASSRVPEQTDLLQRATRMDFSNYLPEDILVKIDRASMLNSLELRAPFLDHRVIEMSFRSIPSCMKTTQQNKKILLKDIAARVLPPQFDFERKQGFSIPLAKWLAQGAWRDFFYDILLDASTPYDNKVIKSLLNGQDKGRNNAEKLFGLVMLELWRRQYSVDFNR